MAQDRLESFYSESAQTVEFERNSDEANVVETRCRALRRACEDLLRRELALMHELNWAAAPCPQGSRSVGEIVIDLGSVRAGLGEADRFLREAERRGAELQRRASDLLLVTSLSRRQT
jgi:hypothetical protein